MCFLYAEGVYGVRGFFSILGGRGRVCFVIVVGVLFLCDLSESTWGIIKREAGVSFYVGCTQFYVPGEEGSFVFTQNDPPQVFD